MTFQAYVENIRAKTAPADRLWSPLSANVARNESLNASFNRMNHFAALLLSTLALAGCTTGAGGGGAYDPNARETLGHIVERRDTGTTTRQAERSTLFPVGGLLIPIPLGGRNSPLPVFEHRIALDDGRNVVVYSWYPEHHVGTCIKLFESERSDYPRMINSSGCKQ